MRELKFRAWDNIPEEQLVYGVEATDAMREAFIDELRCQMSSIKGWESTL